MASRTSATTAKHPSVWMATGPMRQKRNTSTFVISFSGLCSHCQLSAPVQRMIAARALRVNGIGHCAEISPSPQQKPNVPKRPAKLPIITIITTIPIGSDEPSRSGSCTPPMVRRAGSRKAEPIPTKTHVATKRNLHDTLRTSSHSTRTCTPFRIAPPMSRPKAPMVEATSRGL